MNYLSIKQIQQKIPYHRNTINKWIREGKLKAFKLQGSRRWLVKEVDFGDFIEKYLKAEADYVR